MAVRPDHSEATKAAHKVPIAAPLMTSTAWTWNSSVPHQQRRLHTFREIISNVKAKTPTNAAEP